MSIDDADKQAAILRDTKEWASLVFTNVGAANERVGRALISADPKTTIAHLRAALEGVRKAEDMLLRAILNAERIS